MPLIDEIKEQQEKVKQRDRKARLRYFWDYYRIHTIIAVVSAVLLYFFLSDYIEGQKDCIIYAMMLNGYPATDTEQLMNEFLTENGYNPKKVHAVMETGLSFTPDSLDHSTVAVIQKLLVMTQSGTIDILIADRASIEYYAEQRILCDLREILPEEMLENYAQQGCLVPYQMDYTSSTVVPVGIQVEAFPRLMETQAYDNTSATHALCVIRTSPRTDAVIQFLSFLAGNA